jgi:hypothetical protein
MSDIDWNSAIREQFVLHPEKFALVGQYAREMFDCVEIEDYLSDMLAVRLSTAVLCGRTVSETPQVVLTFPESPWQHLKDKLRKWEDRVWCDLHRAIGRRLWLWPVYWTAVVTGKLIDGHPVKWGKVTADVSFEQRILYPEVDAPAQAGRPVIYETLDVHFPTPPPYGGHIAYDPSRFLNRHEIANAVYKDPDFMLSPMGDLGPHAMLNWLERHGVNVDQLVKRK